jgi:hypothetical protein
MYLEGPTTGRLDTDFLGLPVFKKMAGVTITYLRSYVTSSNDAILNEVG